MKKYKLPNWEVAVYCLYSLGGISQRISTEDIALRCYELVPDCFSWTKYTQYPDKDVARSALVDARKAKHGSLVQGRAGRGIGQSRGKGLSPTLDGWMLTESGVRWIKDNDERLSQYLQSREAHDHRQDSRHKLLRYRHHFLFGRFLEEPNSFHASRGELAELFKCRVDADRHTWEKRLNTAANLAHSADDEDILEFLSRCRAAVEEQLNAT